jgi:effector-binding domain-containing protein
MLDVPGIVELAAQPIAVIPITVPRGEIATVMWPGVQELMAAVAAQGLAPTGPWFAHHTRLDPLVFEFEIGVTLARAPVAAGRMRPATWPAMTAARTVYQGPFEGLHAAWAEFGAWIVANGHPQAPDLWERYLLGPDASPDPAAWRTELIRPLLG